jgi:predicted ribosome quality control (RQC) complex YloA/Tae2 family protein
MEARLLQACVHELAAQIAPRAQVLDVGRPANDRIDLLIEREGGRARLAIDLAPSRACAYLARPLAAENPDEALRRFLVGQWITGIDRPVAAPIMRVLLTPPGGVEASFWLVVEWLGGRPDVILVDARSEEVLSTLLVPAGAHAGRRARGERYAWPPRPHRPDYGSATDEQVAGALRQASAGDQARALARGFAGLPVYLAYEALHRGTEVAAVLRAIASAPFQPVLYEGVTEDPHLPRAFVSPIAIESLESRRSRRPGSLNRLIEQAHISVLGAEADADHRVMFLRSIEVEERRLMRLHDRLRAEATEGEAAPLLRRHAEALLVHMGEIPRGASSFTCPDPQDPSQMLVIELDPRRSASSNADAIFRRARRLERGAPLRTRRMRAIEEAVSRLSVLRAQSPGLAVATKGGELLHEALGPFARRTTGRQDAASVGTPARAASPARRPVSNRPAGGARGSVPATRKRPEERFHPRTYTTREGWTILVGRSNEENDYVTHALARPEDYWFHAHGCPGSHVVLRREGRKDNPSVRTLEEAASIAAWFSKARTSRKAPIVYTLKKYVRRPRKGPPGLALITREKLILVEPKAPPDADRGGWVDEGDNTT